MDKAGEEAITSGVATGRLADIVGVKTAGDYFDAVDDSRTQSYINAIDLVRRNRAVNSGSVLISPYFS